MESLYNNNALIGEAVEKEFGTGGLSDGLYMDFAEKVALEYAKQERERIIERINDIFKQYE